MEVYRFENKWPVLIYHLMFSDNIIVQIYFYIISLVLYKKGLNQM
jgi:hypothetical protein